MMGRQPAAAGGANTTKITKQIDSSKWRGGEGVSDLRKKISTRVTVVVLEMGMGNRK